MEWPQHFERAGNRAHSLPGKQVPRVIVAIVLLPYLLVGCGQTLPATVTGTVTLDGQPLPEGPRITGSVMFYPVGGGAAAYGIVTSGGKYAMQTGGSNGLQSGEYLDPRFSDFNV